MPNVQEDDLLSLAHSFHELAFAVGQVRLNALNAGAKLDDAGMVTLKDMFVQLTDLASRFALASATVTLDHTEQALKVIQSSTAKANQALQHLKQVDQALAIGAAALALGVAIFSMDMKSIAATAQDLYKAANPA